MGDKGKLFDPLVNNWIVYTMRPDYTTKDPKAKNRAPFYLTVAIIQGSEPTGSKLEEIYQKLDQLTEVETVGSHDDLSISFAP